MIDFSQYKKQDSIPIDDEFLAKLNDTIEKVQLEKDFGFFNYDYLEKIANHVVKYSQPIIYPKSRVAKNCFSRQEIIGYALQFFKSLGGNLYEKALRILFQLDQYTKVNIFDPKDPILFEKSKEFGHMERFPYSCCSTDSGIATISVLLGSSFDGFISDPNKKYNLESLFDLVHEIAHCLDLNVVKEITTKGGIRARVYTECTSNAFEILLLQYLLKNSSIHKSLLWYRYSQINISSFINATALYWKLFLAKQKEKEGIISRDFINSLPYENQHTLLKIADDPESLLSHAKYTLGRLIAPTIVKNYNERGTLALEQYLEKVKSDSFDSALTSLGITVGKTEIIQLVYNMLIFQNTMIEKMREDVTQR